MSKYVRTSPCTEDIFNAALTLRKGGMAVAAIGKFLGGYSESAVAGWMKSGSWEEYEKVKREFAEKTRNNRNNGKVEPVTTTVVKENRVDSLTIEIGKLRRAVKKLTKVLLSRDEPVLATRKSILPF